jgi:nucleotide-binding universal stress UspA family protein
MHYLVPIDFSDNSQKALDFALALATSKADRITLLHVVETHYDFASQVEFFTKQQLQEGKKRGKELLASHGDSKINLKFRLVEGNPALQITQLAAKQKVDLIVMGTKGASGITKTLIGTVAVSVVREATCPVLVIPEAAVKTNLKQFVLGLEFADHEPPLLNWVATQIKKWKGHLQVVHVRANKKQLFKQELLELGIKYHLNKRYPSLKPEFVALTGGKHLEALSVHLKSKPGILVMCHAQQGFLDELFTKSDSLQMAFHAEVPLLVLR